MEEKQGYGKRPLWQWLALYAVIGIAVYGLIYYFVFAGKGGYSKPAPTATPTISPVQSVKMTVKLNEENNSGESGKAILKEENNKTTVILNLTGLTKDIPQPAHIHMGSCPEIDAVKYPLTNVVNGSSVTVLDATVAEIKQNLPLAINVHKSPQEITNYTACSNLLSE